MRQLDPWQKVDIKGKKGSTAFDKRLHSMVKRQTTHAFRLCKGAIRWGSMGGDTRINFKVTEYPVALLGVKKGIGNKNRGDDPKTLFKRKNLLTSRAGCFKIKIVAPSAGLE